MIKELKLSIRQEIAALPQKNVGVSDAGIHWHTEGRFGGFKPPLPLKFQS
jgi:hypothetical protein